MPQPKVQLQDLSEIHRPEDQFSEYNKFKGQQPIFEEGHVEFVRTDGCRNYESSEGRGAVVRRTYTLMHTHQTLDFVKKKIEEYSKLNKTEMTVMGAVHMLDNVVDEADPDLDLPNSVHAFQTAERIREAHPDKEWFQLTGLLHDLGKVMALWGEPQFAVVGDTFPLGCKFAESIVFQKAFENNPDSQIPEYSTEYGIYEPHCGLNNVFMSWGHDEYMYQVLKGNGINLPNEALYMIRFHSFYPWHTGGDYDHLCNDEDREMLKWVKEFSKFDLYSKADNLPDVEAIKPHYQRLIDKYCPGKLRW